MPAHDDHEVTIRTSRSEGESQTRGTARGVAANPDASVPFVFGKRIAQGGMGAILEAQDCKIGRTIAVKLMLSELNVNEDQKQRFINEAAVLGRLEHPNIVPIHDLGRTSGGELYYTMKLVKGRTLKDILNSIRDGDADTTKQYTLDRLLTIFRKVCDAMAFAHSHGVIHRDLKPENIMVGEFGEVLVMDWGLAKFLQGTTPQTPLSMRMTPEQQAAFEASGTNFGMTMEGDVMGTPQYMSPEQANGSIAEMDARSDIFSLGGILYTILTLRPPVVGRGFNEILRNVATGNITSPTIFGTTAGRTMAKPKGSRPQDPDPGTPLPHMPGGRVPAALSAVVMKALSVERERRYQDVAALSADIEKYQGGFATTAENAGAWKQLKLLVKRNKAATLGVAAVLLVGTAFGTKAILEGRRAERGEAQARAALAALKKQAPALLALAETEAGFQRFDSALEKLDAALALDPTLTAGWWRRAWLLLAQEKFTESAEAVRAAQQRDPARAARFGAILPLLGELATAPAESRWTPERGRAALAHLKTVEATGETIALSSKLQLSAADKTKLIWQRLREWLGPNKHYVGVDADGSISLSGLPKTINTLEPLRGLPINRLTIDQCAVTSLEPLRGMPLHTLSANTMPISDLSPLKGQPIERLNLDKTAVEDLGPLRGMPLVSLNLDGTKVRDLSPLADMKLTSLNIAKTYVTDLGHLQGMPLGYLNLAGTRAGPLNLSALRGMPLKYFNGTSNDYSPLRGISFGYLDLNVTPEAMPSLAGLEAGHLRLVSVSVKSLEVLPRARFKRLELTSHTIRDLTPLRECRGMEELIFNACPASIEPLRGHPTLKRITYSRPGEPPGQLLEVEQFWAEYDAKQAAGKK